MSFAHLFVKTWKGMKQTKMEWVTEQHFLKQNKSIIRPMGEHRYDIQR